MASFGSKLKHAWNAFSTEEDRHISPAFGEVSYGPSRPDRVRTSYSNERSIVSAIYTRLAVDFASFQFRHIKQDDDERFLEEIRTSGLNNCLSVEANPDQAARQFRQDIAHSLFQEGVIAIVPVDTTQNPIRTGGYDIQTMRVGTIVRWMPRHVRVSVWNIAKQRRQEVTLEKRFVAIVENPFYSIMNEPNSTLQRLIRKLALLDIVDEQTASGKLDLIIQLPYVVKTEARREQAMNRRNDLEAQLKGSRYGIGYTDGTERITQLNRPAENNLMKTIEYLLQLLYTQLGLTPEIMNGTADEATMLNYYHRTQEPLLEAVLEAMRRSFLTKTARTQGQTVTSYRDPFKLMPLSQIAEIGDKLTRSEAASSNDIRQIIGWRPSSDPKANELRNTNMPDPNAMAAAAPEVAASGDDGSEATAAFDELESNLDGLLKTIGEDPDGES